MSDADLAMRVGRLVLKNRALWEDIQSRTGAPEDGIPGDQTVRAILRSLGMTQVTAPGEKPEDAPRAAVVAAAATAAPAAGAKFPKPDFESMAAFYGSPGDAANIVDITFPYPMRLYSRSAPPNYLRNYGCHRKVRASLLAVLEDMRATLGMEYITKHGLDVFCGIFNDRAVRGGTARSKHAWGVAIDLNADENGNNQAWRADKVGQKGWATMPVRAVEIFERHGWKSFARELGRDAMHFQATL